MPTRKNNGWIPDIFNDFFDTEWMPKAKATAPAINVIEDEKKYTVEVAAPGMCKEDFDIQINENNDLDIKRNRQQGRREMQLQIPASRILLYKVPADADFARGRRQGDDQRKS